MSESLREAVEGFERDRAEKRGEFSVTLRPGVELVEGKDRNGLRCYLAVGSSTQQPRFRRDDVLDLLTAANDARQLAIASPKLAEQALRQATRLSDLAERIAMLLEGGE